ncbi:condensation domain-containing protein [Streptomyces thinghirensis]|nr:condensation domain-containing protein [Streptomyces thinghirensis]
MRARLAGGRGGRRAAIAPVDRDGGSPLSHGQQQMWFLSRLDPDSWEYSVPVALRLRGRLSTEPLRRGFEELVARHEILRTRYGLDGTDPVQLIDPPGRFDLPVDDLTGTGTPTAREERARLLAEAEPGRPFDLAGGAPLRARLIRVAEDDHLLVVVFHHVACDEWSVGLFLGELAVLYQAFGRDEPSPLAPLPVQYADYAAWQRRRLDSGELDRQLDHWRERLAGLTPLRCRPTAGAPPPGPTPETRSPSTCRPRWPARCAAWAPRTGPPSSTPSSPATRACSPPLHRPRRRRRGHRGLRPRPARAGRAHRLRDQHSGPARPVAGRPDLPAAPHRCPGDRPGRLRPPGSSPSPGSRTSWPRHGTCPAPRCARSRSPCTANAPPASPCPA